MSVAAQAQTLPTFVSNTEEAQSVGAANTSGGICGRTPEVRDALLRLVENNEGAAVACADVTDAQLNAITGTLYLRDLGTTPLAAGDFNELTALKVLHLDNNKLTELPDGVFDSLTSLTRLLLYANALETLPDGVFDKLTSLTSLYLSRNQLTSLPAGVFDSLTSLQGLHLDNNLLTTLPDNVFAKLTNLVNVRLERNPGAPFVPVAAALPDDGTVSTDGGGR